MQKKYDLWMADWDDAQGKRHRKGFPTKRAALRFQDRMRREAATKKGPASATSARSARRGPRRNRPRAKATAAASRGI